MIKTSVTFLLVLFVASSSARFIRAINRCHHTITVRTLGNAGLPTLGQANLGPNQRADFHFVQGWSGRMWANNSPGATLFEIAMNGWQDLDFYNISVIDGYNFPMIVGPRGGGGAECRWYKCMNINNCEAYRHPEDDRDPSKHVVSACKGANYEVTFCP